MGLEKPTNEVEEKMGKNQSNMVVAPTDNLEWVEMEQHLRTNYKIETNTERFQRKFVENPMVPIGKTSAGRSCSGRVAPICNNPEQLMFIQCCRVNNFYKFLF